MRIVKSLRGMGEGCGSVRPRWKKANTTRKEKTYRPKAETLYLNFMLSMYILEFEKHSRGKKKITQLIPPSDNIEICMNA